ncbi:MAG: flagellar hook-associated protein FlgK [Marivibrio sp.]|uniref:flagellar hook-associated protein FlgK n=1 Tax=Marivibrio sp. TaxID=2039719 RepID=UPI0032EC76CF
MSLFGALGVAVTSINALNTAVRTVSDNVANANNPNYNRREENFENLQTGGVRIADIRRIANDGLQRDLFSQTADAESNATRNRLYQEIEQLTGTINSNTPLGDAFERFKTAWKAFEAAPESDAAADQIILSGESIVNELQRVSDGLDLIETQVLTDIADTVTRLNTALGEVDRLNNAIVRDKSRGTPTSQLENLRDQQLETVSGLIDIRTFEREDGSISVYTTSGLDLTDRSASTFTWNSATRELTKSGSPSSDLVTGGQLPDGELRALINFVRTDQTAEDGSANGLGALQKLRNHLDEVAYALVDDATAADQSSSTFSALTSTFTAAQQGTFSIDVGAGTTNVVIGGATTVQDVVTAVNAISGARARLTSYGTLEIASTAGTPLTLANVAGTPLSGLGLSSASLREPQTFANAYQFASPTSRSTSTFTDTTSTFSAAQAGTFTINVNDGSGAQAVTINTGDTVASALVNLNALTNVKARLSEDGQLEITSTNGEAVTLANTAGTPLTGLGLANADARTGEADAFFQVETGTNPTSVSRTNLQVNPLLTTGAETVKQLSGTEVLRSLNGATRDLNGSSLRLTNETYTGLANGVIVDVVKQAERANQLAGESETLRSDLKQALRDEVGVSIDEEMARLTVLQNSYAASARVIDSVNQMLQSLEAAVR